MENQEKLQAELQAGKKALERGEYRLSIKHLETARELTRFGTRLGGEVGIWLMSAYQAANQLDQAIALGQKLAKHPFQEVAQQSKRLLYIIQAPQLVRPREWMSE
ncbi:MAG: tetratricopeptide repeat protein, partial [Spirulinaceae cyanobacterium]